MALDLTNWVDKTIRMDKFAEYEHKSMKNFKKGYEARFIVQIDADDGVYFSEWTQGSDKSVGCKYHRGVGDRLLDVHYHPGSFPGPSKGDLKSTEMDSIKFKKFIQTPPVNMVGAKNSGKILYITFQRNDFPGMIEERLTRLFDWAYLDIWKPLCLKRYRKELTERINNELKNSDVDEHFVYRGNTIVTDNGVKNVIKTVGPEKTARIIAESLENNFDMKACVVETYKGVPNWLYGNPEKFD